MQGGAATGDHTLLDRRPGRRDGVLDAVLLLLELDLGGRADLDDGDAAGQLGEALLELLAVPVRVGVLDLGLDLVDPALDVVLGSPPPSTMVVLSLVTMTRLAVPSRSSVTFSSLRPTSSLMTWAPVRMAMSCSIALRRSPKPGRLDGDGVERAADLVDDERGEGLALDVLGDDDERLAGLHHGLERRQQRLHGRDLGLVDQQVRLLEHGFLALGSVTKYGDR